MREVLGLEHLALRPSGPTLSLRISAGQSVAVMGPANSGKSKLIRILAQAERPGQGTLHVRGRLAIASDEGCSRRAKVVNAARLGGDVSLERATEALIALHLYDHRTSTVGDLTGSQYAALELVPALTREADVVLIDGQLDQLDPWALKDALAYIANLRRAGRAFVIVTHRPELAAVQDAVIVLKDQSVRFAGTPDELLRVGGTHTVSVETENQSGVRALVAPFEVSVMPTPDGVRLQAKEGQEVAARLLLEGYGDVKFVTVQSPSLEDALMSL